MKTTKKALVAGHICLDIIPDFEELPSGKFFDLFQPGLMLQIGPPHFSTGGLVSNTGLALHILGVPTFLMGKVGNDMYGQAILSLLRQIDPNLVEGMIVDPETTTSYTIIMSPPGIDRIFLHHPGANDTFKSEDINYSYFEDADLFHFGYPPVMAHMYKNNGFELAELFKHAKSLGATTSLDMSFPDPGSPGGRANWSQIYSNTLPFVDIFSPSIEELLFTLHREKYDELINQRGSRFARYISAPLLDQLSDELIHLGSRIVLLKLGEQGAYLRTADKNNLFALGRAAPKNLESWANKKLWAPCYKVDVIGTTGSGDATIAGFLSALLHDMSPEESINSAVAVGACNVEASDAISGIQSWEATQNRISNGWERHELSPINVQGWEWDDNHNLWIDP